MESAVRLAPIDTIKHGISSAAGIQCSIVAFFLFGIIAGLIIWRGSGKESYDERNFEISQKGTYGTAGFMGEEERSQVLRTDKNLEKVDGVIFGRDIQDKKIISLPVESRLNRNFAVCGSQGSMKSRAFARVMALQCIRRGESIYLTDPKSELYEDLSSYCRECGYTVKQLNLIQLEHSDAWDCLGEIDDGSLIDVFCDVVIRNTTDKFDHFYDNTEMDLLKALCLYVFHEYPPEKRTFPEAYKLLINKSVDMLDAIFERLPTHHPARGPYQLFAKAEKVKGNAVLGLGTRLQIMQNKLVQQITSHDEIDLSLPGREKCAYFCITSDQDSTFDMLATLFTSFLRIANNMLGSDIDFIIRDLDEQSRSVVASRKDAMLKKRQMFYFNENEEEKPMLYPGRIVEARVIAVAPKVVRLEVFGVEVSVRARDMAWEWMVDASEKFQVGDLTLVMVNQINIRSVEEMEISVDAKSATANVNKDNLKRCVRQGKYVGIITDVYKGTYFIRLNIGVNAVAHSCNMASLPAKRDEVGFVVTRINDKFEVAEGIITRMIKRGA